MQNEGRGNMVPYIFEGDGQGGIVRTSPATPEEVAIITDAIEKTNNEHQISLPLVEEVLKDMSDEEVKDGLRRMQDKAFEDLKKDLAAEKLTESTGTTEDNDATETEEREYAEPTDGDDDDGPHTLNELGSLFNEGRKALHSMVSSDADEDESVQNGPFPENGYESPIGKPITLVTTDPSGEEIKSEVLGVCTGISASSSTSIPTMDAINEMIGKYPDTTDEAQGLFRLIINKLNEQSVRYTIEDAEAALKTMKELMTHCRIELLKDQIDLKKVEDASEIAIAMKEHGKSFNETADAIEKLATGDIFGPAAPDENGEVNEGEHSLGNLAKKSTVNTGVKDSVDGEVDEDIEVLCDNMLKDIAIAKATFNVVFDWYNSSHKSTTVYDDILEKLEKDMVTIEASSDLNAGRKLKAIKEVIDSIENRDSSFLLDSLYSKTNNPKRLREIGKEAIKYGNKLYNDLTKLGFTRNDIAGFMNFFVTENQFRNIYNTGEQYINFGEIFKNCPKEELTLRVAKEMCAICFFFLYHIYKICDAERKREYYLTIKYRLGIILICDTNLKNQSKESTFRSRFEEPITEEPVTETEFSLARSKLYDMYMPLLARYYEIMKDPTLMNYAATIARKKH